MSVAATESLRVPHVAVPVPEDPFLTYGVRQGLVRQPGLDGVRGLAILAVLTFHLRPDMAPGGAAGVSLFFTLSGYLITTVILHSTRRHGHFPVADFSRARARRLLPAALSMTAAISLLRATTGLFDRTTRPDALLTTLQVNNWFQVYRDPLDGILEGVSGFAHMWSLSVEQQFYIVIAVAMAVLARRRSSLRTIAILAGCAATLSFLLPVAIEMTSWRTYLGTDTRAGEILIGTTLATILFTRRERELLVRQHWWFVAAGVVGGVAMTMLVLRASPFAYGLDLRLFPYMSLLSASMIVGALVPGAFRTALQVAPLVWLGQRSYAIYLFHIPVSLVVDHLALTDTAASAAPLVATVTFVLAELSYRLIEMPVRTRRVDGAPLFAGLVALLTVIVACSFVP